MPWQIADDVVLVGSCLVVAIVDQRHGITPDWTNAALALLGLLIAVFLFPDQPEIVR